MLLVEMPRGGRGSSPICIIVCPVSTCPVGSICHFEVEDGTNCSCGTEISAVRLSYENRTFRGTGHLQYC